MFLSPKRDGRIEKSGTIERLRGCHSQFHTAIATARAISAIPENSARAMCEYSHLFLRCCQFESAASGVGRLVRSSAKNLVPVVPSRRFFSQCRLTGCVINQKIACIARRATNAERAHQKATPRSRIKSTSTSVAIAASGSATPPRVKPG